MKIFKEERLGIYKMCKCDSAETLKNKIIDMPEEVSELIAELESSGYEAYIVGGCVRDSLLGREPGDWDICTDASPAEMKECLKKYHVIETGIQHGTLTVVMKGNSYEITTYRIDGEYLDSRRPSSVTFTGDLELDLARRDFTINAMAYSQKGGLLDCFGGIDDLQKGIVRCVGNAGKRFNEDALRIMRAVRFASQLGFEIEKNTALAMKECRGFLENIAVERIRVEFEKLLLGNGAADVCDEYRDILCVFMPEIRVMFGFDQRNPYHIYDVWHHTLEAVKNVDDDLPPKEKQILKLAAFFHDIGKPACFTAGEDGRGHFYRHEAESERITRDIMNRLKYDNYTKAVVCALVRNHSIVFRQNEKKVRKLLRKMGEENLRLLTELEYADVKSQTPSNIQSRIANIREFSLLIDSVLQQEQCFSLKDMKIDGRDLIDLGVDQGQEIGEILKKLLDMVVEGSLENDKHVLIAEAKELHKKFS